MWSEVISHLVDSIIFSPKVLPLSLLTLITGSLLVTLRLSYSQLSKDFPDWETLYKSQKVETMPWYNENLDSDLEEQLDQRKITSGRFLDLGTGPATQAIWLAKRGFKVIGSDLSETTINRARNVYANEKNVNFIVDDILNSKLKESEFDYVFDRGCFHVLLPADRQRYIAKIKQIMKDNGILFLKCFSDKEWEIP
jgi:SAM-dependent methyltransferase